MDFVFIPIPCYIQEQTSGSVVQIDDRVSLITSLVKVGDEAKNRFKVQVDVFPMDESNPVNAKQIAAVCIHGPLKQVQAARLWLMNHHLKQVYFQEQDLLLGNASDTFQLISFISNGNL